MNLNVQDISQYLVLLIFVLAILHVVGPGISKSIVEKITGRKESEDLKLDDLIQQKTSQLKRDVLNSSIKEGKKPLLLRVKESSIENKDELIKLLTSLQWGVPDITFCKTTNNILESLEDTQGLSSFLTPLLEESFDEKSNELISVWCELYDKSVLWLNIITAAKLNKELMKVSPLISKKSLKVFIDNDYSRISSMNDDQLSQLPDELAQLQNIKELNIFKLKTEEIFNKWKKNILIFKSLEPIVPISIENTIDWAKEVLGISDELNETLLSSHYEKLISAIHPDNLSSLKMSKDDHALLNEHLEIFKKAYEVLKK